MNTANTFELSKEQLIRKSSSQMDATFGKSNRTPRQKLALTCRILFDNGHDSGLAGQINAPMPRFVAHKVQAVLNQSGKAL